AFFCSHSRYLRVEFLRLFERHTFVCSQIFIQTDIGIGHKVRIELIAFPFDLHGILARKILKGFFESALTDITEWTHHIAPYLYFHFVHNIHVLYKTKLRTISWKKSDVSFL